MAGIIHQRVNLHQQLRENEKRIATLEEQIQAAHKLATLGTMTCLVAHEFNNILTPMINYAELALKHEDDPQLMRKALYKTIEHGNRAALIIQSMLGLVRNQIPEKIRTLLLPLVKECFQCLARDFSKDKIRVVIDIPEDFTVFAVPAQLQQVLLNLIINARQAMLDRGGSLILSAKKMDTEILLVVRDTGCGIEPDLIHRIFDPFFSTKTSETDIDRQGTGLGLAVCKSIIDNHNGSIRVDSQPGKGTTFTLVLPATTDSLPKNK